MIRECKSKGKNNMKNKILVALVMVSGVVFAAAPKPPAVTENYDWRDGAALQLEGRGFPNAEKPYNRLPEKWKDVDRKSVV